MDEYGSLIGSAVQSSTAVGGDLLNYFGQKAAANKQEQFAIQNFNMQNAYNAPSAQMARLKAAGLNPNLVYGSGTVSGNSSTAPSTPNVQSGNPGDALKDVGAGIPTAIGQFFNVMQQVAQTSNIQAQTSKVLSDTVGQDLSNRFQGDTFQNRVSDVGVGLNTDINRNIQLAQTINQTDKTNPLQLKELVNQVAASAFAPGMSQADLKQRLQMIDWQQIQNQLMKMGISSDSPWYMKAVGGLLHNLIPNFSLFNPGH